MGAAHDHGKIFFFRALNWPSSTRKTSMVRRSHRCPRQSAYHWIMKPADEYWVFLGGFRRIWKIRAISVFALCSLILFPILYARTGARGSSLVNSSFLERCRAVAFWSWKRHRSCQDATRGGLERDWLRRKSGLGTARRVIVTMTRWHGFKFAQRWKTKIMVVQFSSKLSNNYYHGRIFRILQFRLQSISAVVVMFYALFFC